MPLCERNPCDSCDVAPLPLSRKPFAVATRCPTTACRGDRPTYTSVHHHIGPDLSESQTRLPTPPRPHDPLASTEKPRAATMFRQETWPRIRNAKQRHSVISERVEHHFSTCLPLALPRWHSLGRLPSVHCAILRLRDRSPDDAGGNTVSLKHDVRTELCRPCGPSAGFVPPQVEGPNLRRPPPAAG